MFKKYRKLTQVPIRSRTFRPAIEQLEDRCLLSTFAVLNTHDDGAGSLRQAIVDANTTANVGGLPDRIEFNIPGEDVRTITPGATNGDPTGLGGLPVITDPVVIDGYSQPGASANTLTTGNDAVLLIELNGAKAGAVDGLTITAGGSTVQGLVINGFQKFLQFGGRGIAIQSDGVQSKGNNFIQGNFIGTNAQGTAAVANRNSGVWIDDVPNNTIGGSDPADRNIIAGNGLVNIDILSAHATGNIVQGNYIGTNAAGTSMLGAQDSKGVVIDQASHNTIGGSLPGSGNVVSGHYNGIDINASDNTVRGNFIGVDAGGTISIPNQVGVYVVNTFGNIIGGDDADDGTSDGVVHARNIISGNIQFGIQLAYGATVGQPNYVQGNFIGTDVTGEHAVGNSVGVMIGDEPAPNVLGGARPDRAISGNLISGNASYGVLLSGRTRTAIQGNRIGTRAGGVNPLGNGNNGIYSASANGGGNTIGGTGLGEGNVIAFNAGAGVVVRSLAAGNPILRNSIHSNGDLGIYLVNAAANLDGVTANDPGDSDTGPNNLQNFPVLTDVTASGNQTAIAGTLDSTPSTAFRLEFFASTAADRSGFGEGELYLGFTTATTGPDGAITFTANLETPVPAGSFVSATATRLDTNGVPIETSEFSANFVSVAIVVPPTNGPPIAVDDEVIVPQFGANGVNVLKNDFDADDGDRIHLVSVELSQAGAELEVSPDGDIIYTAPDDFLGSDTFRYTIANDVGHQASATVYVTVVPRPPVARDDVLTTVRDIKGYVNVLANDFDPNQGDTIRLISVELSHAGANLQVQPNGRIGYTPPQGFVGHDTFRYTIVDSGGHRASATVFVTVVEPNSPPEFTSLPVLTAKEGTTYVYAITTADANAGDTLTITASLLPRWLILTDHGDGTATLEGSPTHADVGIQKVLLVVTDGAADTTQEFAVAVPFVDAPPVFTSSPSTFVAVGPFVYDITTQDVDKGDSLTITALTKPGWLNFLDLGGGKAFLGGVSKPGDTGKTIIVLQVQDLKGLTTTQSFTLSVGPADALVHAGELKELGKSAKEIGTSLKDDFASGERDVALILNNIGITVIPASQTLADLFSPVTKDAADDLKAAGFDAGAVTDALLGVFHRSPEKVVGDLYSAGFTAKETLFAVEEKAHRQEKDAVKDEKAAGFHAKDIGQALKEGSGRDAAQTAAVMKSALFTPNEITDTLTVVFNQDSRKVADTLRLAAYTSGEVAQVLKTVFLQQADGAAVTMKAGGFTASQLVDAFKSTYHLDGQKAARQLEAAGYTAAQAVPALISGFHLTAQTAVNMAKIASFEPIPVAKVLAVDLHKGEPEVITTLKTAGYTASQATDALVDVFHRDAQQVTNRLHTVGYLPTDVALALLFKLHRTADQTTRNLKDAGFTPNQIGPTLTSVFGLDLTKLTLTFQEAGYNPTQIAQMLKTEMGRTRDQVAVIFRDAEIGVEPVIVALVNAFPLAQVALAEQAAITVVRNAGYGVIVVAQAGLHTLKWTEQKLANVLKLAGYVPHEIVQAGINVFGWIDSKVISVLKIAGFDPTDVGREVATWFQRDIRQLTKLMHTANYNVIQLGRMLVGVFGAPAQSIVDVLKAERFTAIDIGHSLVDVLGSTLTSQLLTDTLKAGGFTGIDVGRALFNVLAQHAQEAAENLKAANFSPVDVGRALFIVFAQTPIPLGVIFKNIEYNPDQIAGMLRGVFALSPLAIATQLLTSLGFGRTAIGGALSSVGVPPDVVAVTLLVLFGPAI